MRGGRDKYLRNKTGRQRWRRYEKYRERVEGRERRERGERENGKESVYQTDRQLDK